MKISIEAVCAYLLYVFRKLICFEDEIAVAKRLGVSAEEIRKAESGYGGAEELWRLNVGDEEVLELVVEEIERNGWEIGTRSTVPFREWLRASFPALDKGMSILTGEPSGAMLEVLINFASKGSKDVVCLQSDKVRKSEKADPPETSKEEIEEAKEEEKEEKVAESPRDLLRMIRRSRKITQKKLAELMDLSQTSISLMERGRMKIPHGFLAEVVKRVGG